MKPLLSPEQAKHMTPEQINDFYKSKIGTTQWDFKAMFGVLGFFGILGLLLFVIFLI
jgi:hypothetical protein